MIRDEFKRRLYRLREQLKRYGLSPEGFAAMAVIQDFRCAICRRKPNLKNNHQRRLHVDHDHRTGKVRGLLCMPCNMALGGAQDDPRVLRRMADYLEQQR